MWELRKNQRAQNPRRALDSEESLKSLTQTLQMLEERVALQLKNNLAIFSVPKKNFPGGPKPSNINKPPTTFGKPPTTTNEPPISNNNNPVSGGGTTSPFSKPPTTTASPFNPRESSDDVKPPPTNFNKPTHQPPPKANVVKPPVGNMGGPGNAGGGGGAPPSNNDMMGGGPPKSNNPPPVSKNFNPTNTTMPTDSGAPPKMGGMNNNPFEKKPSNEPPFK
eukprot:CAMPEP_0114596948 /NCGR_PEP_ID=MMETSP0125-20121206/19155_1 /TAXON_ID=485358 ORGANISM="Aristerostoma sp., Strain ATCC 50986" /NCGR_SAMPLE_ID=MMETSP0125 /ASSEMBLY_ACC=CAM_ASM_000245 /LENGTH=220 /DNA_ID=CAMNT_0001800863 /DNA_START=56 /DNA_END=719 /DNA_ORIENTATION=-